MFSKLQQILRPSQKSFQKEFQQTLESSLAQENVTPEELEKALILADLGPELAQQWAGELFAKRIFAKGDPKTVAKVQSFLLEKVEALLTPLCQPLAFPKDTQDVHTLVGIGANGGGKTSCLGKIAGKWQKEGKRVLLAAADTFRAAAPEQLALWGEKAGCETFRKEEGADPASVAYEALQHARENHFDALLVDTSGRLHNRKDLMAELEKIQRVLRKSLEKKNAKACLESLLFLDAATGHSALTQAEAFQAETQASGLVLTKLDGLARGGLLVRIAEKLALPIRGVSLGEDLESFQSFQPQAFARSLFPVYDNLGDNRPKG